MNLTIDIHHHVHIDEPAGRLFNRVADLATTFLTTKELPMQKLQDLMSEVMRATTIEEGVLALLTALQTADAQHKADDAAQESAVSDMIKQLKSRNDALAQALAANTPAQSTVPSPVDAGETKTTGPTESGPSTETTDTAPTVKPQDQTTAAPPADEAPFGNVPSIDDHMPKAPADTAAPAIDEPTTSPAAPAVPSAN